MLSGNWTAVFLSVLAVAFVVRVVDGDTIRVVLDSGTEDTVRLIGVDAPERGEPGYEDATVFLDDLLLHRVVWVETDVEQRDHYGRLLGYVWIDGAMANLALVESGHAVPAEYPPNLKYADILKR